MENKYGKVFVIYALKKVPKMHQNTFAGRAPLGPMHWGSLSVPPDTLAAIKGSYF